MYVNVHVVLFVRITLRQISYIIGTYLYLFRYIYFLIKGVCVCVRAKRDRVGR